MAGRKKAVKKKTVVKTPDPSLKYEYVDPKSNRIIGLVSEHTFTGGIFAKINPGHTVDHMIISGFKIPFNKNSVAVCSAEMAAEFGTTFKAFDKDGKSVTPTGKKMSARVKSPVLFRTK
jgi:hypothetical protein